MILNGDTTRHTPFCTSDYAICEGSGGGGGAQRSKRTPKHPLPPQSINKCMRLVILGRKHQRAAAEIYATCPPVCWAPHETFKAHIVTFSF